MGVTANTPANLVVGAGNVLIDDSDQGATADDNTFRIEQELFAPDNLNGVPGLLIGTHYKTREEAILEATLPEVSATNLGFLWPGSDSNTVGDTTTIDTDGTDRRIPTSDYHDYALVVPGLNGKEFRFEADDALNMGSIELVGQDAGMMSPRIEAHSTWDAADLTASPHRILITVPGS